jgi:dTDP-4-amino-4,6-dideoxygalactose transaminase
VREDYKVFIPFLPISKTKTSLSKEYKGAGSDLLYFELGRQAMRAGLNLFEFKRNQHILMPASLCPAVLDPFLNVGMKIGLYKLDRSLQWNVRDIRERITPNTVAVYVIHYFGITYDLREVRALCDEKSLILIEDCALAGFDPSSSIGDFGDLTIFSLWKFHAISDGAVLKVGTNFSTPDKISYKPPNWISSTRSQLKIAVKSLAVTGVLPLTLFKRLLNRHVSIQDEAPKENFGESYPICDMSSYAKRVFANENLKQCSIKRKTNFNALSLFCMVNGIRGLYSEIVDDSVPYCFPLIVDNPAQLQKEMGRDGIETELSINKPYSNKEYLTEATDDFPDLRYLADHVLSVPIHQNIGVREVQHIKNSLLKHLT